jgi:hypothetical protein
VLQQVQFKFSAPAAYEARRVRQAAQRSVAVAMSVGCASTYASLSRLHHKLTKKLGRGPTPEELYRETFLSMSNDVSATAFYMAARQKDQRRWSGPQQAPVEDKRSPVEWHLSAFGEGEARPKPPPRPSNYFKNKHRKRLAMFGLSPEEKDANARRLRAPRAPPAPREPEQISMPTATRRRLHE